jgi:hypothetical protein
MLANPVGLRPEKGCAGDVQQRLKTTDPTSRQRGRPTYINPKLMFLKCVRTGFETLRFRTNAEESDYRRGSIASRIHPTRDYTLQIAAVSSVTVFAILLATADVPLPLGFRTVPVPQPQQIPTHGSPLSY